MQFTMFMIFAHFMTHTFFLIQKGKLIGRTKSMNNEYQTKCNVSWKIQKLLSYMLSFKGIYTSIDTYMYMYVEYSSKVMYMCRVYFTKIETRVRFPCHGGTHVYTFIHPNLFHSPWVEPFAFLKMFYYRISKLTIFTGSLNHYKQNHWTYKIYRWLEWLVHVSNKTIKWQKYIHVQYSTHVHTAEILYINKILGTRKFCLFPDTLSINNKGNYFIGTRKKQVCYIRYFVISDLFISTQPGSYVPLGKALYPNCLVPRKWLKAVGPLPLVAYKPIAFLEAR